MHWMGMVKRLSNYFKKWRIIDWFQIRSCLCFICIQSCWNDQQGLKLFGVRYKRLLYCTYSRTKACMVDLLGRAWRLGEAYSRMKEMSIKANAGIWGFMLGAWHIHHNPELGKLAAEKPFEFEPHKTLNYILLSNMHAEGEDGMR